MPLPKQYKEFSFDSFDINLSENTITFHYSVDGEIFFDPILRLDLSTVKDKSQITNEVFNLGLAEIPSFYKSVCTPKIIIKAGFLNEDQIKFWEHLYTKGLGEFFFRNKIDYRNLIKIEIHSNGFGHSARDNFIRKTSTEKFLVPCGGGKDSIVAAEILKAKNIDFTWYVLEPWKVCQRVIKTSGNSKLIAVQRNPSEYFSKVIELNSQGFYNGHVPITSVYIFSATLIAAIHGFTQIVLSNERSANLGNTKYLGNEINHQYSKSFEFEKHCHDYIQHHINPNLKVYSLLRDLYEIQIVEKFSKLTKYHQTFLSCNKGLKTDLGWCGECAKCAFVFAMLSAFIDLKEVTKIFGKNLFEDENLLKIYKELLGLENFKPWDCVGIPEEVWLAFYLAKKRLNGNNPPYILKYFNVERGKEYMSLLTSTTDENLIPQELKT